MHIILDKETDSVIGPFDDYTDAQEFLVKIDENSMLNTNNMDIFELETPEDWTFNNLDDLLMSNT